MKTKKKVQVTKRLPSYSSQSEAEERELQIISMWF